MDEVFGKDRAVLALTGVFIMSAAAAEATAGAAAAALGGLRLSDVMTPDPDIGGPWMTVAGFIDGLALRSAQAGFPVIRPRRINPVHAVIPASQQIPVPLSKVISHPPTVEATRTSCQDISHTAPPSGRSPGRSVVT